MRLAFFAFKMIENPNCKNLKGIEITSIQQLWLFVNIFSNMLYLVGIIWLFLQLVPLVNQRH